MKKVFFAFVVTSMVVLSSCGDKNKGTDAAATTVNQDSIDKAKAMQATAPKDTTMTTKTDTTTTTTTTEKK